MRRSIISALSIASLWVLFSVLALARPVQAASNTCIWDGSLGNWNDSAHWSSCGGHIPDSGDTVLINGGGAWISGTVTLLNLNLNGGVIGLETGAPASILNVTGGL